MRFTALSAAAGLVLMTLGACTPQSPPASSGPQSTVCTGQRPQMCTRDYRPVCGTDVRGAARTYGNPCEACADKQVVSHRPGTC